MKYKNIFKSWWFWFLVVAYFLWRVSLGTEFLIEYLSIFLGSFIGILFLVSIGFGLLKFFDWVRPKKVTKR